LAADKALVAAAAEITCKKSGPHPVRFLKL